MSEKKKESKATIFRPEYKIGRKGILEKNCGTGFKEVGCYNGEGSYDKDEGRPCNCYCSHFNIEEKNLIPENTLIMCMATKSPIANVRSKDIYAAFKGEDKTEYEDASEELIKALKEIDAEAGKEAEKKDEEEPAECFNCGEIIPLSSAKCGYCGVEFE